MFKYKTDLLNELKIRGYSPARLRKEKLLRENFIQAIHDDQVIRINSLDKLCGLLNMQPDDSIEWKEDE